MVFGSNQENAHEDHLEVVEEVVVQVVPNDTTRAADQDILPMTFTQKTASFLEGIVNGVYTIIVDILHDIASIFFSIV